MKTTETKSTVLVKSVRSQWDFTMQLLRKSIDCFNKTQWNVGISGFQVPWKLAYHTLQCLAYYFRDDAQKNYRDIPPRYGKDWWELGESDAPTKEQILAFYDDIYDVIHSCFEAKHDEWLAAPFPDFETVLGNLNYAQRHTMHHQGGLNSLAVFHKIDIDLWDSDS